MKYRFEQSISKTGWPVETLVVELSSPSKNLLQSFSDILLQATEQIRTAAVNATEEKHWRIAFDLGPWGTFSEHTIWSMVFDQGPQAVKSLIGYLNYWVDIVEQGDYEFLPMFDEYHFIGEFTIPLFLNRFLDEESFRSASSVAVYQSIIRYLSCCDLDYEVHQDEYITKLLDILGFVSLELKIELLSFRLCNGQQSDKPYSYLNKYAGPKVKGQGVLKRIIDFLIDNHTQERFHYAGYDTLYHKLCATSYGTNEKPYNEVMQYVQTRLATQFKPLAEVFQTDVNTLKAECDLNRPSLGSLVDTGFHRYENSVWVSIK